MVFGKFFAFHALLDETLRVIHVFVVSVRYVLSAR